VQVLYNATQKNILTSACADVNSVSVMVDTGHVKPPGKHTHVPSVWLTHPFCAEMTKAARLAARRPPFLIYVNRIYFPARPRQVLYIYCSTINQITICYRCLDEPGPSYAALREMEAETEKERRRDGCIATRL
jgi:hypothetical protein